MNFKELCNEVDKLVEIKGWYGENSNKPQKGRNLVISLALESAELLECFQWQEEADKLCVGKELADIIIFAAQISNVMGIDLEEEIQKKLEYNNNRKW